MDDDTQHEGPIDDAPAPQPPVAEEAGEAPVDEGGGEEPPVGE